MAQIRFRDPAGSVRTGELSEGRLEAAGRTYDRDAVEVVDTGYAFHLKSPTVSKGDGLRLVCETLDLDPDAFVAIGDSENDVSTFGVAGRSYAVANADQAATAAADVVLEESFADGTMSVLDTLRAAADR
mgnify:CR=1 FL=1